MDIAQLKVISGGQTGVDQAALAAAQATGLTTGGWMPLGWRTLTGARADFHDIYNMTECQDYGYGPRTDLNVGDATATLRFAKTFGSPGERRTLIALQRFNKPHLDIAWKRGALLPPPALVVDWLISYRVTTLNVAGNSEQTAPGIYQAAYDFLLPVFALWKDTIGSIECWLTEVGQA